MRLRQPDFPRGEHPDFEETPEERTAVGGTDRLAADAAEPSIVREAWTVLKRRWLLIFSVTAVVVALALLWLMAATPKYTVTGTLSPVSTDTSGSVQGLGGAAGFLQALEGESQVSDYVRFQELLRSSTIAAELERRHSIARKLFPAEWNSETGEWSRPSGTVSNVVGAVRGFFGVPAWSEPSPKRISDVLMDRVQLTDVGRTDMKRISLTDQDPEFALWLVKTLVREADSHLQASTLDRLEQNLAYIKAKIAEERELNQRNALIEILIAVQRRIMLASIDAPYVVEFLDGPVASALPTSPKVEFTVVLAVLFGLILGAFLALFLSLRSPPRSSE